MAAPIPSIPPNISTVTAPLLLGALFNYALYGILSAQVFFYSLTFPNDPKRNKVLVYSVYLFETLQISLATADIYYWLASGFGDVPRLDNIYISAFDTPIMCGIVSFVVQSWFCYRIWVLCGKRYVWWSSLIFLVSKLYGICRYRTISINVCFRYLLLKLVLLLLEVPRGIFKAISLRPMTLWSLYTYMWFVGSATADILIAGTMAYLLLQARAKDNSPLDGILIKLVTLVMETNALTASFALLSLTIFLAAPKTNWFTCPIMIIGKLYSNTLLVSFNNRSFLRVGKNPASMNINLSFQRTVAAEDSWNVRSHNPDDEEVTDVTHGHGGTYTFNSFSTPGSKNIILKDTEEFSKENHDKKSPVIV
ncbi:hypothetical protein BDQ17DRAFT_859802 [Cyathus striatus]|nr:hypothetical protein BDQ17DRAFT_859802 [Cyathus striatus]